MKPLVSILIPAYNAQEWIAGTIRSAIAQTWPRKEIIVVDDGSRDGTLSVAREFAANDVLVVSGENQGAAATRNYALSLAKGDFIQWLDADDLLAADKIERQLAAHRDNDNRRILLSSSWAHFNFRTDRARFVPTSLWQDLSPVEWLFRKMRENLHMQTATWLTSRELTEAAGPWNTQLYVDDDGEYFCRVLLASQGTRFVPESKVFYRITSSKRVSHIGASDKKKEALLLSMKLHVQYLRSLEESERVRRACLTYLQNWFDSFYPERPDLVSELQQLATSLQGGVREPKLRWKYAWIRPLFGWKAAKWAQTAVPEIKTSFVRNWDKLMHDLEQRKSPIQPLTTDSTQARINGLPHLERSGTVMRHLSSNNDRPIAGGTREIAFDCRFFLGDRPCIPHKTTGALCTCEHYQKIEHSLLIIKLDAMGDVLRTTALLPALAKAHPGTAITWITRRESRPLLERNPYIAEIINYGEDALAQLQVRYFDRVINLDAGKASAALASMANGKQKDGFILDTRGCVEASNPAARRWLEMGIFDDLKRQGTDSYQDLMLDILGLSGAPHSYVLNLGDDERASARIHLEQLGIDFLRPVIGLNTGAGRRWALKQWREEAYIDLIERLNKRFPVQFVLLGGPEERERHERLKASSPVPLIDSGCDNPLRHFAAIVAACNLVVAGDTLAMHLSIALGRRTVVLFGPTSAAEIEMYGLGEKVLPRMDCLACYKNTCDFVPNCMELITTEMVQAAVERQLAAIRFTPPLIPPARQLHVVESRESRR